MLLLVYELKLNLLLVQALPVSAFHTLLHFYPNVNLQKWKKKVINIKFVAQFSNLKFFTYLSHTRNDHEVNLINYAEIES